MQCSCSHVIKLKLPSQLIDQFGHVTASSRCKQPEKHGIVARPSLSSGCLFIAASCCHLSIAARPVLSNQANSLLQPGQCSVIRPPLYSSHCNQDTSLAMQSGHFSIAPGQYCVVRPPLYCSQASQYCVVRPPLYCSQAVLCSQATSLLQPGQYCVVRPSLSVAICHLSIVLRPVSGHLSIAASSNTIR